MFVFGALSGYRATEATSLVMLGRTFVDCRSCCMPLTTEMAIDAHTANRDAHWQGLQPCRLIYRHDSLDLGSARRLRVHKATYEGTASVVWKESTTITTLNHQRPDICSHIQVFVSDDVH